MPRSVASGLGLSCLSLSHIKDANLIWINSSNSQHTTLNLDQTAPSGATIRSISDQGKHFVN